MKTISLSLEDIYKLANKTLLTNGCDEETSNILSDLIMKAEREMVLFLMAYSDYPLILLD